MALAAVWSPRFLSHQEEEIAAVLGSAPGTLPADLSAADPCCRGRKYVRAPDDQHACLQPLVLGIVDSDLGAVLLSAGHVLAVTAD